MLEESRDLLAKKLRVIKTWIVITSSWSRFKPIALSIPFSNSSNVSLIRIEAPGPSAKVTISKNAFCHESGGLIDAEIIALRHLR